MIHALSDEQDMRKMGGLARAAARRPTGTMLIGDAGHRRHPALRRLLQQGRDPAAAPSPRGHRRAVGDRAWRAPC
ncbi:MAG: hypothetical protein MZV64_27955 [Ignavibacteriales bacterium]|nr:hypothetical protein [Ignavibacteriales bacterium]